MMAELKTKATNESVEKFLKDLPEDRRKDCYAILEIMRNATKAEPKMWGSSIVGFGAYHYRYESGRENDWFLTGFSPRKQNLTLYVLTGFTGQAELLSKLGRYKTGKGCLYINRLEDVDKKVLNELVTKSVKSVKKMSKS
jgi:hypothetical protein